MAAEEAGAQATQPGAGADPASMSSPSGYNTEWDPGTDKVPERRSGVPHTWLKLENIGIRGNGHFHVHRKNSDEVAGVVLKWIEKNVKTRGYCQPIDDQAAVEIHGGHKRPLGLFHCRECCVTVGRRESYGRGWVVLKRVEAWSPKRALKRRLKVGKVVEAPAVCGTPEMALLHRGLRHAESVQT